MSHRKKLIEVALPLNAINEASSKEKSIRYGHPSTLHLWWARRPLATCRAVLFASLIDDPSEHPEQFQTPEEQNSERGRLFKLIEKLVDWKNANNQDLLKQVRLEIEKATDGNPPPVLDLFAGGGSIPLEAQRLGLEAHANDLNPVAVLINKALIEIPPKFANQPPINPEGRQSLINQMSDWKGAHGLTNDIWHYGQWMRHEAEKRIGHLYPKVTLPKEYGEAEATVIAWIWVRTVKCSNPACGSQTPLISSFWLSKKKGRETWVEPIVDHTTAPATVHFQIKQGSGVPPASPKIGRGANFKCVVCENIIGEKYVKGELFAKRVNMKLIAIVAEGKNGRVYLSPAFKQEDIALRAEPTWIPEQEMPKNARWFSPPVYGMTTYGDLFTSRQLLALTTFGDLIQEVHLQVLADATNASMSDDNRPLHAGGSGALAYADAVATYLGLNISRLANRCSSNCFWDATGENVQQVFARQAIPMIWDFVEGNPFSESTGNFLGQIHYMIKVLEMSNYDVPGDVRQQDATNLTLSERTTLPMISTDPPYYDNIGYADLSDFFYIWLRRSLANIYPDLFRTMLVPKSQELVATPYRFAGDKKQAQQFFESGLAQAFARMYALQHPDYPLTVYYAFKQSENEVDQDGLNSNIVIASTGWETMLEGLIRSGFTITGTWPMRTELVTNLKKNVASLASSIVLVCRPRPIDAPVATRREFLLALKRELPEKLRILQYGGIAPVDLAQASIGPGMSIYSRYSQVVESDGVYEKVVGHQAARSQSGCCHKGS